MKVKKKIIIVLIAILAIVLLIISLYFYGLTSVSKKNESVEFVIKPGTSTQTIINNLSKSKLIKSEISTIIYLKFQNGTIKAGTYELNRSYDTKKIIKILTGGKIKDNTISITFVEGKRLTDYVSLISEKLGISEEEILSKLQDKAYLESLIAKYEFLDTSILNSDIYYPLEGYLFPATYEFYKDAKVEDVITKMLAKTEDVLDNYSTAIEASGYSVHEILTMASIIENETMFPEDRNIVSQVIYKRLDTKMSLGMDVTTYYGAKKALSETLTQSDLNSSNAYNTRNTSFLGLPVGPICNPSEKSLEAALKPSDTDYVYFYADIDTGKLYFANTYSEFQALIQKYS